MLYLNYTIFYFYFIILKLVLTSELNQSKIKYLLKIKYSLFWLLNYRKYLLCSYLMKNIFFFFFSCYTCHFHSTSLNGYYHFMFELCLKNNQCLSWFGVIFFVFSNTSAMYILTLMNSVQRSGDNSQNNTLRTRGDIYKRRSTGLFRAWF